MENIRDTLKKLASQSGDDLAWFADRMADLPRRTVAPRMLPVVTLLEQVLPCTNSKTLEVTQAICATANLLNWQQSYTRADGFDQEFLDNYGWFNLVSPEGIYLSGEMRISVGHWGAGSHYSEHWHQPEEFYIVLAGCAEFQSQGSAPRQCHAGDVIHHRSNQRHSIVTSDQPLLAAAFWRGEGLVAKSQLKRLFPNTI